MSGTPPLARWRCPWKAAKAAGLAAAEGDEAQRADQQAAGQQVTVPGLLQEHALLPDTPQLAVFHAMRDIVAHRKLL